MRSFRGNRRKTPHHDRRFCLRPFEPALGDVPTVFCLHYLGGSAREWARVAAVLERSRCVALDLPGFGDAATLPGYSVAEMAQGVVDAILANAPPKHWLLAGHSMGAKVAAAVARRASDGARGLQGLIGLVLVAGSPPSPEPISNAQRETMLGSFRGDAAANRADAERYVALNSVALDEATSEGAIGDALRANAAAWRAWFESGSKEDWSQHIGVLQLPTLIVAGAEDENLGPDAQRSLMAPHFANVRSIVLPGAKHLLPLERPAEVAHAIDEHAVFAMYRALIDTNRVSSKTRQILLERGKADDPHYVPTTMDAEAFATLRAVVARVVPQSGTAPIDLAARIDRLLAAGGGDGWRFAILPPDAEAFRVALRTLAELSQRRNGVAFAALDDATQDEILECVASGSLADGDDSRNGAEGGAARAGVLNGEQIRAWFEDVRAEATKAYVSHPQTLARIGYSGIANGGDGEPKSGFALLEPDEREAWEPRGVPVRTR